MKKILIFMVILLFCIFLSYNIYHYNYGLKINKIQTSLNEDLEELKLLVKDNETILHKVEQLENYVLFQQSLLFIGVEDEFIYK